MNPEARGKTALVALIVVLAVMAALGAAPALAGQSWEQSPDCDQSIAVWRRLPLVNTRHRMEFGGYARDVGATGQSPLLEIAFPGGVGSEIPAHVGRRWMNPPAGLVQSRWDWAAMGRPTHSQAFPSTQIAPTGYISYTIRPEDVVSQSEILANPYYVEKIHSVYWTRPFYQTEQQRQRVTDECIFQESIWRILVRNDPTLASITDPDQRRLEVLRVAAMNPALAERMPGFRNETLPDQGLWRQIVVEWLERIQEDHPHAFRYWLDRCLEGAKMDSSVVGTVVRLPTPERPTAEAPELSEWGLKWDAGRKVYVTVDNRYGLPAGSEAGIYLDQKYLKDGQEQRGLIGLKAPIIQKLVEQSWTKGERVLPLMFDPRGKEFEIYSIFWEDWGIFTGFKVPGGTRLIAPCTLKDYSVGNFMLKTSGESCRSLDFEFLGRSIWILYKSGKLITNRSENVAPGTILVEVDEKLFQTREIVGPGNVYQTEASPSVAYPIQVFLLQNKPTFLSQ